MKQTLCYYKPEASLTCWYKTAHSHELNEHTRVGFKRKPNHKDNQVNKTTWSGKNLLVGKDFMSCFLSCRYNLRGGRDFCVRRLQQARLCGGEHRVHHGHLQATRPPDPAQVPAAVQGGWPQGDASSGNTGGATHSLTHTRNAVALEKIKTLVFLFVLVHQKLTSKLSVTVSID